MFLTMAGVPVDEPANGAPIEGPEEDSENDGTADAPYVVLIDSQVVTEEDLDTVFTAIDSLEVRPPHIQDT